MLGLQKKHIISGMLFPKMAQSIFSLFDLCIVSNQETKKFLQSFNAKNIFYFGNLKFCENLEKLKLLTIIVNF